MDDHICNGLAWGTALEVYTGMFGGSDTELPDVSPTWEAFDQYVQRLDELK